METVTLQGQGGSGLGFEVGGNAHDGFVVQDLNAGGAASASGRIKAGEKSLRKIDYRFLGRMVL